MLKKHQIKKIIKQMVPSSVYSNPQRKMLRETAKTELYDYITKYPDTTYANLQQQFCDNEIINSKQMQTSKKIMKLMIGILVIRCRNAKFFSHAYKRTGKHLNFSLSSCIQILQRRISRTWRYGTSLCRSIFHL